MVTMADLSSLIKKINNFYKGAAGSYLKALGAPPTSYYMPDEPEEDLGSDVGDVGLYPKIMDAAQHISDADVRDEVLMIGELYKKALEVGGGYNFINKAVSNLVNLLDDEDDDEQMAVEDLMNEISRDLRTRAKSTPTGDSDEAIKAIRAAKDEIDRRLIAEDLEEEVTPYEAGLSKEPASTLQEAFPIAGDIEAGGKRGWGIEGRTYKDWAKSYENERQRFVHELTAPELQLSRTGLEARTNTAARNNLQELVDVLGQMVSLTTQATQLEAELQAAPDDTKQKQLEEVRQNLQRLQGRRMSLKKNLRRYQYDQQIKSLQEDLGSARSDQEKFLISQKIKLNELRKSPDKGKDEETKWLKVLINSMSGGNALPPDQIAKIQQKIQEGAAKKTKATQLWREKAEQVAALKGTVGPIRERQVGESGAFGKRNQYNFDALPLDGLVEHLTQRLATERVVVKQKVTDKMKKAQQDPAGLKPYMDDVAKAATKKDKTAFLAATQRLKQRMTEFKNVQPEVVSYVISLRTSKFFYNFRDRVKKIGEWIGQPIDPEQVNFIDDTIRDGQKLASYYKGLKIKPLSGPDRSTHYKPPTEIIEKIVKNLEGAKYGQS